jgi:hypothetical protein
VAGADRGGFAIAQTPRASPTRPAISSNVKEITTPNVEEFEQFFWLQRLAWIAVVVGVVDRGVEMASVRESATRNRRK